MTLEDQTPPSVMRWNSIAIILCLVWGWQLATAFFMEIFIIYAIGLRGLMGDGTLRDHTFWLYVLLATQSILILVAAGEVYLYALDNLPSNLYFELAKTSYIVTVLVMFGIGSDIAAGFRGDWKMVWEVIWKVGLFLTSWILALGFAVYLRFVDARTRPDEESPLFEYQAFII